jgi:hypothetical protein
MANYKPIGQLARAGKGVTNGYDDSEEREFFIKELPSLFGDPEIEIKGNNKMARCDLSAYKNGNLFMYIELDRSGNDFSKKSPKDWGHVSIFGRKYNGLFEYNKQAPVLYIWTGSNFKEEFYVLNLRDINLKDYPLQKVYYTKAKRNKGWPDINDPNAVFEFPFDYHAQIPLDKVHHYIF